MVATSALSYIEYCSSEMISCVSVGKSIFYLDVSVRKGDKMCVRGTFLIQRSTGPMAFGLFCFADFQNVFSSKDT